MSEVAHRFEDRLLELAYGELPRHEAEALEVHVRECRRCAEALEEMRGVRALARELPVVPAPEAGLDSLLSYATEAARRSAAAEGARRGPWRRWLPALAPLVALGFVAIVAWELREAADIDAGAQSAAAPPAPVARSGAAEAARAEPSIAPAWPAQGATGGGGAAMARRGDRGGEPSAPSAPQRSPAKARQEVERSAERRDLHSFEGIDSKGLAKLLGDEAEKRRDARVEMGAAGEPARIAEAPPQAGTSLTLPGLRAQPPGGNVEARLEGAPVGNAPRARRSASEPSAEAADDGRNEGTNDGTSLRQGWESNAVTGGALGLRAGLSSEEPGDSKSVPTVAQALARASAARARSEFGAARAFARAALDAGALGAQRRLALELLCELLEPGARARDEAACEVLGAEFPDSAVAARWAPREGRQGTRGPRGRSAREASKSAAELEAR